jgi:hypothetical protein
MRTRWRRRALLAGTAATLAAAAAVAPSAITSLTPAVPRHVAIERHAVSTQQTVAEHAYELHLQAAPAKPVQWLACRPIAYRINSSGEPKGMTALVKRVMASIGTQTGATFVYAGRTNHTFSTQSFSSTSPTIYISFTAKRNAYGQHFSWPGEVGVGGPAAAWLSTAHGTFEAATYGRVLLYTGFHGPRTGAGATWQSLITHEVGHALNLDHRSSKHDAMYPSLTASSPGRFSRAEVTALHAVLKRTSCDYRAFAKL